MVIEDHVNLMNGNPLVGPNDERLGPRFPDLSAAYDRELIERALAVARREDFSAHKGVYVAVTGPNLETRAEYRFLRLIGADVVGMSTVPEVLVAAHAGMRRAGPVDRDRPLPARRPAAGPPGRDPGHRRRRGTQAPQDRVGGAGGGAERFISMNNDTDGYGVHSPWGAIAAFFLLQCFGFVALQGFRTFVSIGVHGSDQLNTIFVVQSWEDRVLMPLWGLIWIFAFVVFQCVVLHRIANYLRGEGLRALFAALKMPSEALKAACALLFAFEYVRFLLGHYPFPSRPISVWMSMAFGGFSWGVSALFVWFVRKAKITATQQKVGTAGKIFGILFGFLTGAFFLLVVLFMEPGLFYFHGMLGLFCITMFACQLLFLSTRECQNYSTSAGQ